MVHLCDPICSLHDVCNAYIIHREYNDHFGNTMVSVLGNPLDPKFYTSHNP